MILSAIFFVGLDRAIKVYSLVYPGNFRFIGNILKFNPVENKNIAFSLPLSGIWLEVIIAFTIIFLTYILINLIKKQAFAQACFLLFVILGAASNLYDRIFFGGVIDYLDLRYFTVFNLADVMIVSGALALALSVHRNGQKNP